MAADQGKGAAHLAAELHCRLVSRLEIASQPPSSSYWAKRVETREEVMGRQKTALPSKTKGESQSEIDSQRKRHSKRKRVSHGKTIRKRLSEKDNQRKRENPPQKKPSPVNNHLLSQISKSQPHRFWWYMCVSIKVPKRWRALDEKRDPRCVLKGGISILVVFFTSSLTI